MFDENGNMIEGSALDKLDVLIYVKIKEFFKNHIDNFTVTEIRAIEQQLMSSVSLVASKARLRKQKDLKEIKH